jgi:hypothetical protein
MERSPKKTDEKRQRGIEGATERDVGEVGVERSGVFEQQRRLTVFVR